MSAPEQSIATCRHRTTHTLTCARFPSKSEREVAQRRIEPNCPLCGQRNQIRQAFSEGDCRTSWIDAAKATRMHQ
jgi:hypothetical protein